MLKLPPAALPLVLRAPKPAFDRFVRRALVFSSMALLAFASLLSGSAVQAQATRAGLVRQPVNEADRVVLKGNTHPAATKAADRGAVDPAMPAARMLVLLKRSTQQELALKSMIESLHDANSPNFHKWLTPQEFGARWGAADSDIAAVTAWLQSHGFHVLPPSAGKMTIEFSGTAGQVREAFHTSIHTFEVNGELHHANVSDPQIPAALASVVAGITHLNDFHPRSMVRKGPRGIYDASSGQIRRDVSANGSKGSAGLRPNLTASDSSGDFLYVGPADAATIYDSPNKALNPAYTGATIDGAGARIGIIGDSNVSLDQITNYQKLFGLVQKAPTVIIDGGTDPGINGDAGEAYLDLEVSGGFAPGAKVYLYTAADTATNYGVDLAAVRAVNDNIVDVLSMSFGECEGALGTAGNQFYQTLWSQAVAQGISVTVSTGDSGSAGCDDPDSQTVAYYGLQVNGLASTAYNIAVGGTDFYPLAGPDGSGTDFTKYVSTKNAKTTLRSTTGYIAETPWNDSTITYPPAPLASNQATPDPYANIAAGSGGKSNCSQGGVDNNGNLVCTAGNAKPSWQAGVGVPADQSRDLPDVSLFSSDGFDYATWGICTDQDQDSSGNPITDCTPGSDGLPANEFYISGAGGTSSSAPAFAGVMALVRQSTGDRQGQANYVLYRFPEVAPSAIHDVTVGNNSVACQSGTPNCSKDAAGDYFLTGYSAASGYDLASGLGSVDVSLLLKGWAAAALIPTTTTLTVTPTSLEHGQTVTADITVSNNPTGNVELLALADPPTVPKTVSLGTFALKADGTTGNIALKDLPGGNYSLEATYGGSATLASSVSAPVAVTISPEPSTTLLSAFAIDPKSGSEVGGDSVPYGYFAYLRAMPYGTNSPVVDGKVQPDGIPTGRVDFTAGPRNVGGVALGTDGIAISAPQLLQPGAYPITAKYLGDASYEPSASATKTLTVTKAATTLTLSSNSATYSSKPIAFTVELATMSAGVAPTGKVRLLDGSTIVAEATLDGKPATKSTQAYGSVVIDVKNPPPGENKLRAEYFGDENYAKSASNFLEIKGRPTFSIANIGLAVPGEHSTAAGSLPIKSLGGYTGTVKLKCEMVSKPTEKSPPECTVDPSTVTLTANGEATPLVLIYGIGTKLPKGVSSADNSGNKSGLGLGVGTGGVALACCLLFGIPARRRGWRSFRSLLSMILLLAAVAGFSACSSSAKFISAGVYQFKVTGTDSTDATNTASATVNVTVY
jgi:hypothetical protein